MSRDRLLGILWPDADEDRARHALSQTLYSLRRDLGVEPVVGGTDLRIDPAVLTSDVAELQSALAAGDWTRAIELYASPFLEGFYLDGATEFERWAEEQRGHLQRRVLEAAEALAEVAARAGDSSRTVAAWQRATLLDPLSSRYAMAYMNALAATGDRAGALAHARGYETLVRRELEAAPDGDGSGFSLGGPPPYTR